MLPHKSGTEKRGRQQGGSLFGKTSLLYAETVIEYHSVSKVAALQQHDKVERDKHKTDHPARPSLAARCTVDNDISFVSVYVTGVPTLCDEVPR